jgi:hypothetical protein
VERQDGYFACCSADGALLTSEGLEEAEVEKTMESRAVDISEAPGVEAGFAIAPSVLANDFVC